MATDETIDERYVFKFEAMDKDILMFQGFSGRSYIIKHFNRTVWELVISYDKTTEKSTIISYLNNSSNFPFGTNNWTFIPAMENGNGQNMLMKVSKVN